MWSYTTEMVRRSQRLPWMRRRTAYPPAMAFSQWQTTTSWSFLTFRTCKELLRYDRRHPASPQQDTVAHERLSSLRLKGHGEYTPSAAEDPSSNAHVTRSFRAWLAPHARSGPTSRSHPASGRLRYTS